MKDKARNQGETLPAQEKLIKPQIMKKKIIIRNPAMKTPKTAFLSSRMPGRGWLG
ncbi:MAG: hypothetical protein WAU81_09180 [Candidatus Aminicenantales bacterium]